MSSVVKSFIKLLTRPAITEAMVVETTCVKASVRGLNQNPAKVVLQGSSEDDSIPTVASVLSPFVFGSEVVTEVYYCPQLCVTHKQMGEMRVVGFVAAFEFQQCENWSPKQLARCQWSQHE